MYLGSGSVGFIAMLFAHYLPQRAPGAARVVLNVGDSFNRRQGRGLGLRLAHGLLRHIAKSGLYVASSLKHPVL